jgi:Cysteine-rich CPCC
MDTLARVRCLCCGFKTLDAPDSLGLCPVCWWQDDGQDDSDAEEVRGTVNGELSLAEARNNFQTYGAAHARFVSHVRKPLEAEV